MCVTLELLILTVVMSCSMAIMMFVVQFLSRDRQNRLLGYLGYCCGQSYPSCILPALRFWWARLLVFSSLFQFPPRCKFHGCSLSLLLLNLFPYQDRGNLHRNENWKFFIFIFRDFEVTFSRTSLHVLPSSWDTWASWMHLRLDWNPLFWLLRINKGNLISSARKQVTNISCK